MLLTHQAKSKDNSGIQSDVRRGYPPSVNALHAAHRSVGNRMVQRMVTQHLTNASHGTIQRQLSADQVDELEYTVNNYALAAGFSKAIVDRTLSILQKRHNSVAAAIQDIDNAFGEAFDELKGTPVEEIGMDIEDSSSKQTTNASLQVPNSPPQTQGNTPTIDASNQLGSSHSGQQFASQSGSYPESNYPSVGFYQQPQTGYGQPAYYGQYAQYGYNYASQQQPQTGYEQPAYYGQYAQYGYNYASQQQPQSYSTAVTNQADSAFQQIIPIVSKLFPDKSDEIIKLLEWASVSPMIKGFKTWYSDMMQRAGDESMVKDMLYELLDVQREILSNYQVDLVYHLDNDKQSASKSFDYKVTRDKKYPGLTMSLQENVAKHEVTHVENLVHSSADLHPGVKHIAEKVLKDDKDAHKKYTIGGTIAMTKGVATTTSVDIVLKELLKTLTNNPSSIEGRVTYLDKIVVVDHNFKVLGTFTKNKFKWTLE
ncbi:hypothetical protein GQF01_25940 [Paenibacillus sp. 5J-6]|uniref:Uncharacterized protein n=1 Tax=Paenibacillus silvestris TaxID=2606219 RepID=A0A6L8V7G2_9BACL|nr:hypothetical protein [Paenibacillus silvestris]MZQ85566.1 hypothetical protein [Paenibacillus silvestris]